MLHAWALPVGMFVGMGLIVLYDRMEAETRKLQGAKGQALKRAEASAKVAQQAVAQADAAASRRSLRTTLDMVFLALIFVATLAVVMYDYRYDPVVSFARAFPNEARFIEGIMRRLRSPLFA